MSTTTDRVPELAPTFGPPAPYAGWLLRVVATIIDDVMLTGVVVAAGYTTTDGLGFLSPSPVWTGAVEVGPVVLVVFLAVLALQAYVGASPGKLVVGIAVVGDRDARPIGLLRTGGRWMLHLLDAILLIGYLRPLWNAERRTFADSLVGTVVVRTRQPRPHRHLARWTPDGDGPPLAWSAPVRPRWQQRLTWGVGLAALPMVLVGLSPVTTTSAAVSQACEVQKAPSGSSGSDARLTQVSLVVDDAEVQTRGFWWSSAETGDQAGVRVDWIFEPVQPLSADLRLELRNSDGSGRSFELEVVDGVVVGDPDSLETDSSGVLLSPSVLDGLEDGWGWQAGATIDGVDVGSCGWAAVGTGEPDE